MPAELNRTSAVIEARDISKVFGRFTAVNRVTFDVRRTEVFGLLGPNGAGKSTMIRMLCGLLSSTAGSARVGGFDINTESEQVRQNIGYMSQKFSLYKDLTVTENIKFFGGVYGINPAILGARISAVLEETSLADYRDQFSGSLSGAIQQRLALACAIVHEPPILFLDEPTSGVDPISRRHFWDIIRRMTGRGVTVLVTTHFMDEAEFCGRIGFISAGKLMALGTPAAIKKQAAEEDIFEVSARESSTAREQAAKIGNVTYVSYFGPKLHVFCRRGAFTENSLKDALRRSGIEIGAAGMAVPTLEDAFVRLAKKSAEGGA